MKWPFVSRTFHELRLHNLADTIGSIGNKLDEALDRERYWRERCERLTDAALAKAGAIHEPTMVDRKPATSSLIETAMSGYAVREIESARH